jgi:hypothetical protein
MANVFSSSVRGLTEPLEVAAEDVVEVVVEVSVIDTLVMVVSVVSAEVFVSLWQATSANTQSARMQSLFILLRLLSSVFAA